MYTRELQREILRLSEKWSVISITGPRQSGKTTLCKMCFPQYDYVNLEHLPTRNEIAKDIDDFFSKHTKRLIIDEAQYLPDIFSYIQVWVDEDKSRRFILSGSSDFLLMQSITQSLAGRVAVKRLLPLSISELGGSIDAYSTDELMFNGFFPGIWGAGQMPKDVYESYFSTYIQRDVRRIVNIKDIDAFQHFVVLCAGRVGCEFNAQALSNETGITLPTIKSWMNILETSYTAFRLHPYFVNIGKRLSKTPKIYFYDVGLVCYLLNIESAEQLASHPLRGAIFENMVICEFLKKRFNKGEQNNIFFYRDKSQREVDIVQTYGTQLRAYEVKSAKTYNSDFFKNLEYFRKLFGDDVVSTQIIFDGTNESVSDKYGLINFRNIKDLTDNWINC